MRKYVKYLKKCDLYTENSCKNVIKIVKVLAKRHSWFEMIAKKPKYSTFDRYEIDFLIQLKNDKTCLMII